MLQIYDVSAPIFEGMPVYKNKPEKQPAFEVMSDFTHAAVRESRLHLDVHTGTHVDAPLHMLPQGQGIDSIALERLVTTCRVLDLTEVVGGIEPSHLEPHLLQPGEFVLFKTRNSSQEAFDPEFVYVSAAAADYLVRSGVRGVGIDALGIERGQAGHPTHKALFAADVVIIEGLRLAHVPAGQYLLIAAPLKLVGLDAAPARVLLISGIPLPE